MNEQPVSDASSLPAWYIVSLVLPADVEDDFVDQVRDQFDVEPVQLQQPNSLHTWVELYYEQEAEARSVAAACEAWGEPVLAVSLRRCDSRDWHSFWKTHFRARAIGKRLFLKPVWCDDVPAEEGRRVLQFVPGLSFGTGEHFTTQFCLEMIDRLAAPEGPCHSMWDVGCGSGMLGTAAALLGVEAVLGTDNDPICEIQSRENAALNGVAPACTWRVGDVLKDPVPGRFDLVCANLFAPLLIQAAPVLWEATGAFLALSGIREPEGDAVVERFLDLGAREVVRDGDGAWMGLLFERVVSEK